ncbi:MAG: AcrR family transcriptional regulator [Candidatus Poriferisodalaceae bacterium]
MCEHHTVAKDNDKKERILDAGFEKFTAYGFARTSMADIAQAAGMSRPALYLHFDNKDEILRSMLHRIMDDATTAALAELSSASNAANQLDGFLQRYNGDLAMLLQSTEHGAELIEAKQGHAKSVIEKHHVQLRKGLTSWLATNAPSASRSQINDWVDLIMMSPIGFKYDGPTLTKYRRRLSTLAASVAAAMT